MAGMTISEKIFSRKLNRPVRAGEIVFADVDLMMATDGSLPLTAVQLQKMNGRVMHPEKVALVQDHFVPAKDVASANASKTVRKFARDHGISNYFEVGRGGICHHVVPDAGLCRPGDLIVGADSHTCTYGAFGAFATGVGSTDLAFAFATGKLWFRVPSSIRVNLTGRKGRFVQGKDIALRIISELGVDGANHQTLEFAGNGLAGLGISDRITLSNMSTECGAKAGIVTPDEKTRAFIERVAGSKAQDFVHADPDATYEKTVTVDIDSLECLVAMPWRPDNVTTAAELEADRIAVDQVYIGSCTNGRIEDMVQAMEILRGQSVHDRVRLIVTPGTQAIYGQMLDMGLAQEFLRSGATITPPTCGACVGGHMGLLADDEVCVSTSNRNFLGRMGSRTSKVYLANPYVAAASAVKGYICTPDSL